MLPFIFRISSWVRQWNSKGHHLTVSSDKQIWSAGDSRQNVRTQGRPYAEEDYQGPKNQGVSQLSNHQLYPGMYFPPEHGPAKNPFNYHFTIGMFIRKQILWIKNVIQYR